MMATIRQSIQVRVPIHTACHQLTRFEDYPRFMQEVDAKQLDDTHLHWASRMANRPVGWDAEIIEPQQACVRNRASEAQPPMRHLGKHMPQDR